MKKKFLSIIVLLCIVFLTGCGNKYMNAKEFYTAMREKKFSLTDITSNYDELGYVTKAYLAQSPSLEYQIEFFEIDTDQHAKDFFEYNKDIFEKSQGNLTSKKTEKNEKRISKYHSLSSIYYLSLSRIDNTVIYARVKNDNKSEVRRLIRELGY